MSSLILDGDPRRRAIDHQILDWMREETWEDDEARFSALACDLFRFQLEHCEIYARFCEARGVRPDAISNWREIPALPTTAFKEATLTSFDPATTIKTFRTSGTTTASRGKLQVDTLALYEASLLPTIRRFVFPEFEPGGPKKLTMRVLASEASAAPDSSLSHMFSAAVDAFGNARSGYDDRGGVLDSEPLIERLLSNETEPIALCGTTFAFVHLLEAFERGPHAHTRLELPKGSRIMETGGFKGRSREVPRDTLYAELETRLGIPASHIVNQYGMTELGSQFYDSTLFETRYGGKAGPRRKIGPPWARLRLIDPESGNEAAENDVGIIVIHDLANTGSIAAIQTADLGRRIRGEGDGFEVLGRAAVADARGCSIAADARWLEASR